MKIPYRNKLQEGIRQVALKQIRRVEEKWRKKVLEIYELMEASEYIEAQKKLEELLK